MGVGWGDVGGIGSRYLFEERLKAGWVKEDGDGTPSLVCVLLAHVCKREVR